ncbi:hypothetical protein DFJ74DRAFT_765435, partial [Hyaloraphidium curvatum]
MAMADPAWLTCTETLKLLYNNAAVACPDGCGASVQMCDIDAHLRMCPRHCSFCGSTVSPPDSLLAHYGTCSSFPVKCAFAGCGLDIRRGNMTQHQESCPKAPVPCTNQGCSETVLREQLTGHLAACPRRIVKCPHFPNCGYQ